MYVWDRAVSQYQIRGFFLYLSSLKPRSRNNYVYSLGYIITQDKLSQPFKVKGVIYVQFMS